MVRGAPIRALPVGSSMGHSKSHIRRVRCSARLASSLPCEVIFELVLICACGCAAGRGGGSDRRATAAPALVVAHERTPRPDTSRGRGVHRLSDHESLGG
jgi:hypothetical protein